MEDVLDVVEVAPDDPFEFAAPEFGVRVEEPPEDLGEEESFTPNITALLSEIMSSNTGNMRMDTMPEVPPAQVALSSTVLRAKKMRASQGYPLLCMLLTICSNKGRHSSEGVI